MKRQFLFGTMFAVALGAGAAAQTPSGSQTGSTTGTYQWQPEPGADGRRDRMSDLRFGRRQQRVGRRSAGTTGATGTTGSSSSASGGFMLTGREHVQCIGHELG